MTKGSDALPFAHLDDERVWVSSAYVVERAPMSRKADSKGLEGRGVSWVGLRRSTETFAAGFTRPRPNPCHASKKKVPAVGGLSEI